MESAAPPAVDIWRWRDLDTARQRRDLAVPETRRAVFSSALAAFRPSAGVTGDPLLWDNYLDFLALMQAAERLSVPRLHGAFLSALPRCDREAGHVLPRPADEALPTLPPPAADLELDALNQALDKRDLVLLGAIVGHLAADTAKRGILMSRLEVVLCVDNYRQGWRLICADHLADLVVALSASDFTTAYLRVAAMHFSLPEGHAVVVPEGRSGSGHDIRVPLLTALRQRDLPAFLQRIRVLGDEPVTGFRQLLLACGMLILERGVGDATDRQRVALTYLRLVALLKARHGSRRLARRAFFSAAAQVFELAGWTPDPDWPDYAGLLHAAQSSPAGEYKQVLSWEAALQHLRLGRLEQWWQDMAEAIEAPEALPLFWPIWVQSRHAMRVTEGPLHWIHALIPLRLFCHA